MNKYLAFVFALSCWFTASASEPDSVYHFKGTHFLASYCDCSPEALTNVESLKEAMLAAVEKCGATILNHCHYVFSPDGFSMVILLSESHASIHTYPEHGSCFVDLFTCGEECSSEAFDAVLREYLHPKNVSWQMLQRDQEIH